MNCLCLLQAKSKAKSNPAVIKILTTAVLEQNHSVFTLDKECLEPAMDQLHSTSRSFIYNAIMNWFWSDICYCPSPHFFCQRQACAWWVKHQFHKFASFHESSNMHTAPCSSAQGIATALSHSICCHDVSSPTCHNHKMLPTGIQP